MIRAYLADDHEIVRAGVRRLLETQTDFVVVGEAADGATLLRELRTTELDVLVLDLSLPDISGLPLIRTLGESGYRFPIVVLTAYPEDQLGAHLLRAGASAYLCKSRSPDELLAALRVVAAGGRYVTDTLQALDSGASETAPHERLSARESQVFFLVISGKTISEVAYTLELSISTVSNHVAGIREKLGTASVSDIVLYAHRVGLLT